MNIESAYEKRVSVDVINRIIELRRLPPSKLGLLPPGEPRPRARVDPQWPAESSFSADIDKSDLYSISSSLTM